MQPIPDPRSIISAKPSQDAWLALYAEWEAVFPRLMASAPAEHRASLGVFSRQFKTCLGYAYEKRLEDQQRHPGFKSAYVSDWHFDNLGRDIWAHEKALFSAAHTANPMAMQIIQQLLQFAACELNPSLTERAEDKVELAGRQEAMRLRLEATCKAAALTRA